MRWNNVHLESVVGIVPDEVVTSAELEAQLHPTYSALHLGLGQLESLTGIKERRRWPKGMRMSTAAALAGRKALDQSGVPADELGAVVFAGVCRDDLEPATACAVAAELGTGPEALIFDVSNACLGLMNGMVEMANRIELGQMRAGLVVSAESSREIVQQSIQRLNAEPNLERYRLGLATMTGGSGAAAVLLTAADYSGTEHRLMAGAARSAPQHHRLCRWGPTHGLLGESPNQMDTDASGVLEHGVALGRATWDRFLSTTGWRSEDVDRVICHQVGAGHRKSVMASLGLHLSKDYSTFETYGNMGTVSVPLTAAAAHEAGVLSAGQRVGWLGIGSGLNCMMLAMQW
jgi:3-oxoacyl-[acyl-carrier-protein] synthase III